MGSRKLCWAWLVGSVVAALLTGLHFWSHPTHIDRSRVALLLTGHPRTFLHVGVHSRIHDHLIQTLQSDSRVDTFLALAQDHTTDSPEFRFAVAALGPSVRGLEIHPNEACQPLTPCCSEHCLAQPNYTTQFGLRGCLQFRLVLVAIRMAQAFAREHGFEYQWLVRARPDVAYFEAIGPLTTPFVDPDTLYMATKEGGQAIDHTLFIPTRHVDAFVQNVLNPYEQDCRTDTTPEYLIFDALRASGVPTRAIDLPATIVRAHSAECFRVSPDVHSRSHPSESYRQLCETLAEERRFW